LERTYWYETETTGSQNTGDKMVHWKKLPLSLENKILIYKTILKPVWTYGIELWGCANKSNIAIIAEIPI